MSEYPVQPVPDASDRLDPVAGSGTVVCPDCGYHNGWHDENCHLDEGASEAELRAIWGDR